MEGKEGKHGVCSIVLNRDLEDNVKICLISKRKVKISANN